MVQTVKRSSSFKVKYDTIGVYKSSLKRFMAAGKNGLARAQLNC